MIEIAPYPHESSFFPEHLIIPVITLVIFLVILYVIARIKRKSLARDRKEAGASPEKTNKHQIEKDLDEIQKIIEETPRIMEEQVELKKDSFKDNQSSKPDDTASEAFKRIRERMEFESEKISEESIHFGEFKTSDIISLIALIVTIVLALVAPFNQLPVLDYTIIGPLATDEIDTEEFEIVIRHTFGMVPAKNVVVSLTAESTDFAVLDSKPFLGNALVSNISNATAQRDQIGKALLEIKELPPRSHTIIRIAAVSQNSGNELTNLLTHIRSDEVVAYHQTSNPFIFYGILCIWYAFFAYIASLRAKSWLLKKDKTKINYATIVAIGILILAGIISANLLLYLSYLEPDSILYRVFYYAGTLVVPAVGTVLGMIYDIRRGAEGGYRFFLIVGGLIISGLLAVNLVLYLPHIERNNIVYYYIGTLAVPLAVIIASTVYTLRGFEYRPPIAEAGLLISALIAASLLFYFPPVDTKSGFYHLHYWVGILVIPVMIAIILAIYQKWMALIIMSSAIVITATFLIPYIPR